MTLFLLKKICWKENLNISLEALLVERLLKRNENDYIYFDRFFGK